MNTLFPNYIINLKDGTVFHKKRNGELFQHGKCANEKGYHCCVIYDIYGNKYSKIHQVILAEGLGLPKHLWPTEENGRKYIPDHILPISNGGTDSFSNLRLIPRPENNRNPYTLKNQSEAQKGRVFSEETKKKMSEARKNVAFTEEWSKNLSIARKKAWEEGKYKISDNFLEASAKRKESLKIPIYQYTLDGELVAFYLGRNTAEKETGFNRERITFHCKDGKPYKGYLWSNVPL